MYSCHLCDLKTKQLNGLMSRHYKTHITNIYSVQQYKRDVLTHNGRLPKNCKVCLKETVIPKGENEYPDYCRVCYDSLLCASAGDKNINWKGGKKTVSCSMCKTNIEKHPSHLKKPDKFCSTSCSQTYYGLPENRTEAQKANDIVQAERLRKMTTMPHLRAKLAKARNILACNRSSRKESHMVSILKSLYPNSIGGYLVKYYTFDAFIPSLNMLVEFDGTYWHSLPSCVSLDKRKTTYIKRWHSSLKILRIKENDWDRAIDKSQFLSHIINDLQSSA
jgi:hypothetical protein